MADKICDACKQEITGSILRADGTQFHPECFKCDKCGERLKGPFHKKDGQRICESCIPKSICYACKKEITGPATQAAGNSYHPECFKCEGCGAGLGGGFFKADGKIVCKTCVEKPSDSGVKVTAKHKCVRCKLPIEGKMILGDKDDAFHEECFTCEDCNKPLDDFVVDESRKFKHQTARYICPPCAEKGRQVQKVETKPCCICKEPCLPDDSSLHLLDGYCLHWSCFKCIDCGKAEQKPDGDTSTMTLLRSKVELVRKGKYRCEKCFKADEMTLGPAPEIKVNVRLPFGSYVGKLSSGVNNETAYSIRLMENSQCWLDCTTTTPISSGSWHAQGIYEEFLGDDGKVATVKFTNKSTPHGGGPAPGTVYEMTVEKGESNNVLVCEGIKCSLLLGVPDFDIQEMMRPAEKQHAPKPVAAPVAPAEPGEGDGPAPKVTQGGAGVMERTKLDTMGYSIVKSEQEAAAPAAPVPTAVPQGCHSLEDLRDPNVWKALGIDSGKREQYLSDEAFQAVFGVSKDDFEKQPKWKRDQQKKAMKLF